MSFVVNGIEWEFEGLPPNEVEALIDRALAFVEISMTRGEDVYIGDDFQIRPMYGTFALWDLFGEDSPVQLTGEVREGLTAWLNRAKCYLDCEDWPHGFENTMVAIADERPTDNADVAWVHHMVRERKMFACFTLGATAEVLTKTNSGAINVHFVGDEVGRRKFWRAAIVLEGDNRTSLCRNAPHAYPDIYFFEGALENIDQLSGGYSASRHIVRNALAVMNDWGYWVFTHPPPALSPQDETSSTSVGHPHNQLIENRFAGFGLTVAPENPNVRMHRVSRQAREIILNERVLYCEWHIKLEPHKNRIHVHAPVAESGNKVVLGIIHEHLPLPP